MDIEVIKAEKDKLEAEICAMLNMFMATTKTEVDAIYMGEMLRDLEDGTVGVTYISLSIKI